jgi:hypothetical protein
MPPRIVWEKMGAKMDNRETEQEREKQIAKLLEAGTEEDREDIERGRREGRKLREELERCR